MHLSALTTQSSKSTATAVGHGWGHHGGRGHHYGWVEAIIMVITIGETSLPLMLIILGEAAFGRLFLWSHRHFRDSHCSDMTRYLI